MKIKLLLILFVALTFVQGFQEFLRDPPIRDPPIPQWGGCNSYPGFQVKVNMTDVADSPQHPKWAFKYYYMHDAKRNQTYSRYEHQNPQWDEVCAGVKGAPTLGESACIVLHSTNNNWMYLKFPTKDGKNDFCCKCTDKIGAVRYDWMINGGTTYNGTVDHDVNGQSFASEGVDYAYAFLKYGASDNWYYTTADTDQKPVRFTEHKHGDLKQWDFDLTTYECQIWEPFPDYLFAPFDDCETRCQSATCAFGQY